MKKYIISLLAIMLVIGINAPVKVSAQTSSIQSQLEMIAQLTKQIQELQNQINSLKQKQAEIKIQQHNQIIELVKNLRQGSTGEDVTILQALLAADPDVYPEGLITGLYGPLTTKAVRKFQAKYGIEQAGVVGPKTLKKLNELLKEHPLALSDDEDDEDDDNNDSSSSSNSGKGSRPCAIVPPGHLIAKGWLKKNEKPLVPVCQNLPPGIGKKIDDDDDDDDNATTTPDTTAPVITAVNISNITTTGATITWSTNENSDSDVYFSTVSPLSKPSSTKVSNNSMVINHSINLTGLAPSTVYHFVVESKDAAGNESTSVQNSFTTATPDTTAPIISNVVVSASSTSATIAWTTNENSTSKVYYGTTTPLVLASSSVAEVGGLTLSHSVGLSSLTASTTYYYIIESKDASNNTTKTSEASFITTP